MLELRKCPLSTLNWRDTKKHFHQRLNWSSLFLHFNGMHHNNWIRACPTDTSSGSNPRSTSCQLYKLEMLPKIFSCLVFSYNSICLLLLLRLNYIKFIKPFSKHLALKKVSYCGCILVLKFYIKTFLQFASFFLRNLWWLSCQS